MKKTLLFITLAVCLFSGCFTSSTKEKEIELKQKELELKEKEVAQIETNSNHNSKISAVEKPSPANSTAVNKSETKTNNENINSPEKIKKGEKRIRYLFYANGGLVGYLSDGSVVGCPRCDLSKENVAEMTKMKSMGTYTAKKEFLLVDGKEKVELYEGGEISRDWAIVDYKKIVDF